MDKIMKNLKRMIGSILIISLLFSMCSITVAEENDVNTDGGSGKEWKPPADYDPSKGASTSGII